MTEAPGEPSLPRGSVFRALSNRSFALLWAGQSISRLGDAIYRISLAWWVLEETGSAAAMGAVLIFSIAPVLVFVLVGGVIVDRISRLRVMFWADLIRGGVALVLAIADGGGALDLRHVFVASVVFGMAGSFFQPAYAAVVPEVVGPKERPSANSLGSLSTQVASLAGPAAGAACIAIGGAGFGFGANAVSFLLAAVCVVLVPWRRAESRARTGNFFREFREGLQTVAHSSWLWVTITLAALVNLSLAGPMSVALPFLIKEERGLGAGSYGALLSFAAAGAILMAFALGRLHHIRRRGLLAYLGLVGNGVMLLVFATGAPLPVLWLAAFGGGACLEMFALVWTNTLQDLVPEERLGRVFSLDQLGSFVLLPAAYALAGWGTNALGARDVLLVGGFATTILSMLGILHPAVRRLD